MSELLGDKKKLLKVLIKDLHRGVDPVEAKEKFKEVLQATTPTDIAEIEQELMEEGMPREEIERLCHLHLDVFKESLEQEKPLAPPGHPINILMEEHKMLETYASDLAAAARVIDKAADYSEVEAEMKQFRHIVEHLKRSESHYVREENIIFPYLEKHGITGPPAAMWTEHDKIREMEKVLYSLDEGMPFREFSTRLKEASQALAEMLSDHFTKENKVLFPAALRLFKAEEWPEVRRQFDDLGYCCFTPEEVRVSFEGGAAPTPVDNQGEAGDDVSFAIGSLSKKEIEHILNTLPVDITFVDANDEVRYFSQSKERIFPRTAAIIGRSVKNCHPQKSVHVVEELVQDFKSGKRENADFWIELNGRFIYIRYFPIRDAENKYMGCLEVTQDITDVKKITGEKRLL